jgi:hypothetical protein
MSYIFWVAFLTYGIYTLRFAIIFNRTADIYFNKKQKVLHNILIWLIPFFWIMIVKTVASPPVETRNPKKRQSKGKFYESGIGIWGNEVSSHSGHDSGPCSDGE